MSVEPRLPVVRVLFAELAPSGDWIERVMSCGCVSRGRWVETAQPPLRWWLGYTKCFCGAHMPRVRGGANR